MLVDDWFGLTNPKPHPTRVILDLDKPTFAVLQREASRPQDLYGNRGDGAAPRGGGRYKEGPSPRGIFLVI
jgi:hypothetical protein